MKTKTMDKIKLPVQVEVGGKVIKIKYVNDLTKGVGEDSQFGEFIADDNEIRINTPLHRTIDQIHTTLFHELTHACLRITGHTEWLGSKKEEAVVLAMENILGPLFVFRAKGKVKYRAMSVELADE